ncbi:serine protease [Dyadobacter diqingensis]|uniref:serine protease n=1 Tax=Dyadobacter diqingensis TaxID=2938121 RepID=UPI0020C2930D|nr:serine protease [Dyadobacter diqingensis]
MKFKLESIKSLFIEMRFNDTLLSSATAFIATNKAGVAFLITNRHNVTGKDQDTGLPLSKHCGIPNKIVIHYHRLDENNQIIELVEKVEMLYDDHEMENPLWFEHPILKDKADFVALKLTETVGVTLSTYDVTKTTSYPPNPKIDKYSHENLKVGTAEVISVIGFPFGIRLEKNLAIWATGFIASEPDSNFDDLPIFLIDCRTRQGQSGSPVIAYRTGGMNTLTDDQVIVMSDPFYRFMGIYSGRINKDSDLGRVWKATAIKELIESINP